MVIINLDPFTDAAEGLMLKLLVKARDEEMSLETKEFIKKNCGKNTTMYVDEQGMRELFKYNYKELRELLVKEYDTHSSNLKEDYKAYIKELDELRR